MREGYVDISVGCSYKVCNALNSIESEGVWQHKSRIHAEITIDLFESISAHKLIEFMNLLVITAYCQLIQAKMEMNTQIYTYFCWCNGYPTAFVVKRTRKIMKMDFGV